MENYHLDIFAVRSVDHKICYLGMFKLSEHESSERIEAYNNGLASDKIYQVKFCIKKDEIVKHVNGFIKIPKVRKNVVSTIIAQEAYAMLLCDDKFYDLRERKFISMKIKSKKEIKSLPELHLQPCISNL